MSQSTTSRAARVALLAPVHGVLIPLEMVPDPVFAQKMVGDGISIDPLDGNLYAPADGEIVQIHPSAHALTLRTAEGLDVLLHIGLDTVRLRGAGFAPKVAAGDTVAAGDLLINFDLDQLAGTARSLLTQMVVTNTDLVESLTAATGRVEVGDPAMEIVLRGESAAETTPEATPGASAGTSARTSAGASGDNRTIAHRACSPEVIVPNPDGIHARPAATLTHLAQEFAAEVYLVCGDTQANAKSIMAVLGLALEYGTKVQVTACGPDAEDAVEAVAAAIAAGLGEAGVTASDTATNPTITTATATATGTATPTDAGQADPSHPADRRELLGAAASPGLAVGTIIQIRPTEIEVVEEADDSHTERRRLTDALDRAQAALWTLEHRMAGQTDADQASIFGAHREILRDPDLLDLATTAIDQGKSAAFGWRAAYTRHADLLAGLPSPILSGRAVDVRDVGRRVLCEITGHATERGPLPPHSILVAEELTPSDTAALDRGTVVGFATTGGGASSHATILARSLDIPAVAGIDARALDLPDGTRAVLDGAAGTLRFDVTTDEVERIWRRQARRSERRAVELAHAEEPAVTLDGVRIEVAANIAGVEDARAAVAKGAEGVGLLRSEFLFLDRRTAPTEDEQAAVYRAVAESLRPGQRLVVRTLDVGGDKPLAYLPIPAEQNPFLGERGIRIGLARPQLLRTQLRAILRAADAGADLQVMFPMVATLDDYRAARAILEEERERLGAPAVPVGVMVEVPSVAVTAAQFAAEADFFSIGTNDLTQYTLAMDRGHPKLAARVDGLHPAVLTLVGLTAEAAGTAGKWAGVCGIVASDPQAVPLLLGLGVRELSVAVPAIPTVKAQIRTLSLADCRELAVRARAADSAAAVRALVPADDDSALDDSALAAPSLDAPSLDDSSVDHEETS